MKIQPPTKIGGVHSAPPTDLASEQSGPAASLGMYRAAASQITDRSLWFVSGGTPPSPDVIGAKDGDCYLNSDTGDVYRLVGMSWVQIANIKGADGTPGTPGGSQYVHNQTSAASQWNVNHNLGYIPHITIVMDDGTVVVADIDNISNNLAIIVFPSPYTGKAVCS